MKKIGFIGLGNMGFPMVKNLLADGYVVKVFDINEAVLKKCEDLNAVRIDSPEKLVDDVDVLFTSLPSEEIVQNVYFGPKGLFNEKSKSKTIMVDTSTVSPTLNDKLKKEAEASNNHFLAAPVSGGVVGAENRTLTFMVGGSEETFHKIEDVLNHLGENIFHVGEAIDSGTTVKLINNLLIGFYTAGVSEALHIANKQGIDLDVLFEMLNVSYGQSRIYDRNYNTFIREGNYEPGFSLDLLVKDLNFAVDLADELDLELPISKDLLNLYKNVSTEGYGKKDMSVLYERVRDQSNKKNK